MTKHLDLPLTKPSVKPAQFVMTEKAKAAIERLARQSMNQGANRALKDDKIQRAARAAIAEAILPWLTFMQEHDPEAVLTFFIQIATMTNEAGRNKIMKHDLFPIEAKRIIEAHVEKMKAYAEAQRAEAAASRSAEAAKRDAKQNANEESEEKAEALD
ncbi:MAG: hypothetical protein LPJ92_06675 [Rhodobacterales bacterium]|nr:hypothetical protein [Rhodobacterales bacterium]MDX5390009.1 hypothetical protein [Rhodobacterales bacterium]MDX5489700.1 hypothetical protein [Rhodobacterales bacterium]